MYGIHACRNIRAPDLVDSGGGICWTAHTVVDKDYEDVVKKNE
jgi:hypothetical protein